MSNASAALTNHMRQTGKVNFSAPAVGVVSHFATCVQIQWKWIALPAVSGGLAMILLLFSIQDAGVEVFSAGVHPPLKTTRKAKDLTFKLDSAQPEVQWGEKDEIILPV
jgi:hypothetical protein